MCQCMSDARLLCEWFERCESGVSVYECCTVVV